MHYELAAGEWSVMGKTLAKKPHVASRADDRRVLNDIRPAMAAAL